MRSPSQVMRGVLLHLVALKRPHGSIEDGSVVLYLSGIIARETNYTQWIDGAGNLHVDCRDDASNRTLFVGHTDTVHGMGGVNLFREDAIGIHACGAPLGADDAAGISLMMAMIGHIPGYYIFTRGEECGGIGSTYLREYHPDLLAEFDRAIAFDRKGTSDIITHQSGGRCCSEEFAYALADVFNTNGMMYMPSDGGVYTDTAEFIHIIPECTNISVGYYSEHSAKEWLDTAHHSALLRTALVTQWDSLPTVRDPKVRLKAKGMMASKYLLWEDEETNNWPAADSMGELAIESACADAVDGKCRDLMDILAEYLNPSDPQKARCQLDPFFLQPDHVTDACEGASDWDMVVEILADNAFIPL